MAAVRLGPAFGLISQAALLATLHSAIGLGPAGWTVGATYGLVLCALLVRSGPQRFGPADWVTLTRAVLIGGVTALTADGLTGDVPQREYVGIVVVALVLDAVDGKVARRTGTVTPFGARFDMEVDAFLILVLSVHVAPAVGVWVLAIGAMRYVYVAVGWIQPWLRRRVPPRYWRKVVAAVQGIVLVCVAAEVPFSQLALVVALALLVESFGRDVVWQWHQRASLA